MPGPARAGLMIYAKHLERMAAFYTQMFGMRTLLADAEHQVLESADIQLVLHAIPVHIAADIAITTPPQLREQQAIKPFFTVLNLDDAEVLAVSLGGGMLGPVWPGPGFRMRTVFDPEGNLLQVRAWASSE